MHTTLRHLALSILALLFAVSCTDQATDDSLGAIRLAAAGNAAQHDVAHVQIEIIEAGGTCGASPVIASALLDIEADALPESVGGGANHPFASQLFPLPPGDYIACGIPLTSALMPSTKCAAASSTPIAVTAGQTSEVTLWSTCAGDDNAGLDVAAGLNGKPVINDVVIQPSKWIRLCETAHIALDVQNDDNDILSYSWLVTGPSGWTLDIDPDHPHKATFDTDTAGDYEITVTIADGNTGQAVIAFPIHVQDQPCTWLYDNAGVGAVEGLAVDAKGQVFAVGEGPLTLESGPPIPANNNFVLKLSRLGEPLWARDLGPRVDNKRPLLAIDDDGNALIFGMHDTSLDLGCGPLPYAGDDDLYLAKFSADVGECRWSKAFTGTLKEVALALVVDGGTGADSSDDTIYIGGEFWSPTLTIPDGTPLMKSPDAAVNGFVIGLASDGSPTWQQTFDDARVTGLTVAPTGDVIVSGEFQGPMVLAGVGGPDIVIDTESAHWHHFVAKLRPSDGLAYWGIAVATGGQLSGGVEKFGVITDDAGDVYVAAVSIFSLQFTGGELLDGEGHLFVAKLAGTDGGHVWSVQAVGSTPQSSFDIRMTADGLVAVVGSHQGSVDFGSGPHLSPHGRAAFVALLAPATGAEVHYAQSHSTVVNQTNGLALATDPIGHVYVGGSYEGASSFDELPTAFYRGLFVAKWTP